jgi:hypothetical protein
MVKFKFAFCAFTVLAIVVKLFVTINDNTIIIPITIGDGINIQITK